MANNFRGTGTAIITPFDSSRNIDFNALKKLLEFNISNGVNYFVVLGTTGESATLTKDEKKQVYDFVKKTVNGRVTLVAGIGGNNTAEVIDTIKHFDHTGYDAILSVSPYYNKPSQPGIYEHFMAIAKESPLPVIIYNVPSRTGSNITADTTLKLVHASNKFIGVKEASGNLTQCSLIAKHRPNGFLLISGDDIITLPMLSFGADGVISVLANCCPKDFSAMVKAALAGDYKTAAPLHSKLIEITELLFADGSPGGVKAALNVLGICENVLRLPLVPVSGDLYQKIKKELSSLN
jgi:4-hydroxy-tetrahydrodipicolinate synthase